MERTDVNLKVKDKKASLDNGNKNSFHGQNDCKNDVEGMIERFDKDIASLEDIQASLEEDSAAVSVKVMQ